MDSRDNAVLNKILKESFIISDMSVGLSCDAFLNDEKTKRAAYMDA